MKELNKQLSKIRFAMTIQESVVDRMMHEELEEDEVYQIPLEKLIVQEIDNLYIQSYQKKLYIKVLEDVYELFFIDRQERTVFFEIIEALSNQKKVLLSKIKDYEHKGLINHYKGISFYIEVLGDAPLENKDINPNTDDSYEVLKEVVLIGMEMIEERKDYLYFKYKSIRYEAKEIAGNFDVTANDKFSFTTSDKQGVFRKIKNKVG